MVKNTPLMVCPSCSLPVYDQQFRPFCSHRCKLSDLAAWADHQYFIPGPPSSSSLNDLADEDRAN